MLHLWSALGLESKPELYRGTFQLLRARTQLGISGMTSGQGGGGGLTALLMLFGVSRCTEILIAVPQFLHVEMTPGGPLVAMH